AAASAQVAAVAAGVGVKPAAEVGAADAARAAAAGKVQAAAAATSAVAEELSVPDAPGAVGLTAGDNAPLAAEVAGGAVAEAAARGMLRPGSNGAATATPKTAAGAATVGTTAADLPSLDRQRLVSVVLDSAREALLSTPAVPRLVDQTLLRPRPQRRTPPGAPPPADAAASVPAATAAAPVAVPPAPPAPSAAGTGASVSPAVVPSGGLSYAPQSSAATSPVTLYMLPATRLLHPHPPPQPLSPPLPCPAPSPPPPPPPRTDASDPARLLSPRDLTTSLVGAPSWVQVAQLVHRWPAQLNEISVTAALKRLAHCCTPQMLDPARSDSSALLSMMQHLCFQVDQHLPRMRPRELSQ
ncbi:hypothetical protein Agub_g7366, partial [Astrephomene gubernaculifera]